MLCNEQSIATNEVHNGHVTFQCVIDCWGMLLAILSGNVVATHRLVVIIVEEVNKQVDGKTNNFKLD